MKRIVIVLMLVLSLDSLAASLSKIDFQQKGELSYLNFSFNSFDFEINKFQVIDDKQVVIGETDIYEARCRHCYQHPEKK